MSQNVEPFLQKVIGLRILRVSKKKTPNLSYT